MRRAVLLVAAGLLAGCAFSQPAAPIRDARYHRPASRPVAAKPPQGFVVVQPGDNLFRIAFDHGLDYRQLAEWNGITEPGRIRAGDRLRLTPPESRPAAVAGPPADNRQARAEVPDKPAEDFTDAVPANWLWPARGKVVTRFEERVGAKGIDIAGSRGSPILAAADGRVIYAGAGLRGYGKLIIIKHSNIVLSAYGHNDKVLVAEGQSVKAGQKVAEMGDTDASQVKLHFEIREYGKPVDPLSYLPGDADRGEAHGG